MTPTKRWPALLALIAITATACGDGGGDGAAEGGTGTEEGQASASGEPISIDLWHIQTDNQEVIDEPVARYMEDNPDVDVNVTAIENDTFKTQIRVALGAGEAPCIFPTWGGGTLAEYVEGDQVIDLTDRVEEDGYRDRFVDASWSVVEMGGRVYAVPVENSAAALVWYNRTIFEEHGLEPPETWDDLLEIVDTLNEAGVAPFALANAASWPGSMYYMYIADRLGGPDTFAAAANREGGSFEDPTFVRAGELLQELVDREAFASGVNGLDWDAGDSRQLLYAGEAAMELMGNWNISIFREENEEFFDEHIGFFPFPEIEEGEGDPSNIVGTIGDNFYAISSTCEHPDEAFEVVQHLIDDEAVELRASIGRIPPVEGFEPEDPAVAEVFEVLEQAESVQLWYDQYLPPELAEVHLETTQALFAEQMTPEEAAARMEQAAAEYHGE